MTMTMTMTRIVFVLALVLALTGCGLVSVNTNIPLFGQGYNLEVVNASDYRISVAVNGNPLEFEVQQGKKSVKSTTLEPGYSTVVRLRNWNSYNYGSEATVTVKGWKDDGKLAGAAGIKLYVYGQHYRQADSWIVRNEHLNYSGFWWHW